MTAEGVRRAHIKKQGAYHDTYQFGVLRDEYCKQQVAVDARTTG
jgi:hypothetical protein